MANKTAKYLKKFSKSFYHLMVFVLIASIIIFFGGFEINADDSDPGTLPPILTSINPSSAYPGDIITLSGTGFGQTQDIGFVEFSDGTEQGIKVYAVVSWNDASVEVAVPQAALSGPVTISNSAGAGNPLDLGVLDIGSYSELDMIEQSPGFTGKKLIIKYKSDSKALKKLKEKKNTLKDKDKTLIDKDIVIIEAADIAEMAVVKKQLQKRSDIESIEEDYEVKAFFVPNDTYYDTYQYNMRLIDSERAWDISSGGTSSVTVAVIDTGVAYENYGGFIKAVDLASGTFVAGYDFVNGDTHPNDDNGHGTHVTGTIAQVTNNAYGCAGLAYNVKIMPIKMLDASGSGSGSDLIASIYWAVDKGAKVINLSLGGSTGSSTEQEAVQYAKSHNVMVICATGNDNGAVLFPAAYPESVAVGSVGEGKTRSSFSNYGPQIDVVAPGEDILQETIIGSGNYNTAFYYYDGTSMATPHVAALAALILSVNPTLTYDQVESNIRGNCEDLGTVGFDNYYGYGLINAYESLFDLTDPDYPILVTSITVTGAGGVTTVVNGGTLAMNTAVLPANATDKSVTWNVATLSGGTAAINAAGLLSATGVGTVTVTATAKDDSGKVGTAVITVSATPEPQPVPVPQPQPVVTNVAEVGSAIYEKPLTAYEETSSGFATLYYNRILLREPDKEGLDGWSAMLERGALTGVDLVNHFISSKECQAKISGYTNEQFITFLYKIIFNRPPDTSGLNSWLANMSAGMTQKEVANNFARSVEFESLCGYFGIKPYPGYRGMGK